MTPRLKAALAIAVSFTGLVGLVIALMILRVVTFQMALLMLMALLGLYVGIGVLVAVWRFIDTLD